MDFGEELFGSFLDREAAMRDYASYEGGYLQPNELDYYADDPELNDFPPKLSDYSDVDLSAQPAVFVDKARSELYEQFQDEYFSIMEFLDERPAGEGGDGVDERTSKAVDLLLGPNSPIYRVFHDAIKMPYQKFCQFMATFYFMCRWNQSLKQLWQDPVVNTDRLMPPKIFAKVLRKIDAYGKTRNFEKRFWEEVEEAFNKTNGNFIHKTSFSRYSLVLDDDKPEFNYGPKRNVPLFEESRLKQVRHTWVNRKGLTNHAMALAASDIPVVTKFEHEDHRTILDCFIDIMKESFNFRGEAKPCCFGVVARDWRRHPWDSDEGDGICAVYCWQEEEGEEQQWQTWRRQQQRR